MSYVRVRFERKEEARGKGREHLTECSAYIARLFRVHLKHCTKPTRERERRLSKTQSKWKRPELQSWYYRLTLNKFYSPSLPAQQKKDARLRNTLKGDDKKRRRDKQCQSHWRFSIHTQSARLTMWSPGSCDGTHDLIEEKNRRKQLEGILDRRVWLRALAIRR